MPAVAAQKPNDESFYVKRGNVITVYHNGQSYTASTAHPLYEDAVKALQKKDIAGAARLLDVKTAVNAAIAGNDRIKMENGRLMYKGLNGKKQDLEGPLVDRILTALKQGNLSVKQIQPLMMFLDNIMRNQLKDIKEELYQFLMQGDMPITVDGCFLAYKKVKSNFKDIYTGTMDNSPGKLVSMDPNKVDRDRTNTCSTGLHFAARSYLAHYGGGSGNTIIVVKVNPRNVMAIPTDYNNAKGRCSEYFVVGECKGNVNEEDHFLASFIFDEDKAAVAPKVKFIKEGMKASLFAMAESYGLAHGADAKTAKAFVRVATSKGGLDADKYVICKDGDGVFTDAITRKVVPADQVKEMAITTKSVRSALVRAVAKARKALR